MFAYSCLSSLIQPLFGLLSDRFSRPWFIPLGVLLAGCGLAAVGWMSGYWSVFAAIVVSGVGAALFHPEGARFANRVSSGHKAVGMSIFSIGGNSGFVLGPLLATAALGALGLAGTTVFAMQACVTAGFLLWNVTRMRFPVTPVAPQTSGVSDGKMDARTNNWVHFARLTVVIVARAIAFVGFNTFPANTGCPIHGVSTRHDFPREAFSMRTKRSSHAWCDMQNFPTWVGESAPRPLSLYVFIVAAHTVTSSY